MAWRGVARNPPFVRGQTVLTAPSWRRRYFVIPNSLCMTDSHDAKRLDILKSIVVPKVIIYFTLMHNSSLMSTALGLCIHRISRSENGTGLQQLSRLCCSMPSSSHIFTAIDVPVCLNPVVDSLCNRLIGWRVTDGYLENVCPSN